MKHNAKKSRLATVLVGAALAAAFAPAASAHYGYQSGDPAPVNPYAGSSSGAKDYSRNSVSGDFTPAKPSSAPVTDYSKNAATGKFVPYVPAAAGTTPVGDTNPSDDGSDWAIAAVGAGAGIALLFGAVGLSSRNARRQRGPAAHA